MRTIYFITEKIMHPADDILFATNGHGEYYVGYE